MEGGTVKVKVSPRTQRNDPVRTRSRVEPRPLDLESSDAKISTLLRRFCRIDFSLFTFNNLVNTCFPVIY